MSRIVQPHNQPPFNAVAVLGIDFARAAFTMTGEDEVGKRFNIAVYADTTIQAEQVATSAGFKEIRNMATHIYM